MPVVCRPAQNLDLQAIHVCEIKGHEIPLDLEDFRPILNEAETHVAVEGSRVEAFICLHVDEESKTVELVRCGVLPNLTYLLFDLLRKAPRMGRASDCTELTVILNELDVEGQYRFFAQRLKFSGRAPGAIKAYGQTYDNYLYRAPFPVV